MTERNLESLYAEAQQAIKTRDYDRASGLLKQILVIDENYKKTSRLLAQMVKLRRRRWYSHPLLWGTLGFVALITLGIILAPRLQGFYASQNIPPTSSPAITLTSIINTQPLTISPTPSPASIPLVWKRVSIGQEFPRDNITAIVVNPKDPDVLYVGTENAGIYKSIDGGRSWQPVHNGLERANISTLIIDPQNPSILYAGVALGGIYKTIDGAQNWFPINSGVELPGGESLTIIIDRQDSQHLYFMDGGPLYESLDAGEEWRIVQLPACTQTHGISNLAVHPNEGKTIFIMESMGNKTAYDCPIGIYKSEDGGGTWTQIPITLGEGEYAKYADKSLAIDNLNPNNIYFSEEWRTLGGTLSGTLSGSFDGGSTWRILAYGGCPAIAFDPFNQNRTYCGGRAGLRVNEGPESPWSQVNIPEAFNFTAIALSPLAPKVLLLGGAGLYVSLNDGKSWGKQDSGLGGSIFQLKIDPAKDSTIYGEDSASQSYISTDNGHTWSQSQIDTSYLNPSVLTVGQCFVLGYLSNDKQVGYAVGCAGWDQFHSKDGGETWEECLASGARSVRVTRSLTRLVINPRDNSQLIIASSGNGVLISKDGCQSWEFGNDGLGSLFVHTLAIDPNKPDTIYAGTDGGAYVSLDFGETWSEINDGLLGATVVYSIVVDKDSNVYAATPYGIFKLEGK